MPTRGVTLESLECRTLPSVNLLVDINQRTGDSGTREFVQVGAAGYFTDGTNSRGSLLFGGDELYKTDGTTAGTVRVPIDVGKNQFGQDNPPVLEITNLTNVNGTLWFVVTDDSSGKSLWRSDGTAAGTRRILDNVVRSNSGNVEFFASVDHLVSGPGGKLWFFVNRSEIWSSDGTVAGTVKTMDAPEGTGVNGMFRLTRVGSRLLFSTTPNGTERLYSTDGTAAGTELFPVPASIFQVNPAGDTAFFESFDGTQRQLYRTDGFVAGLTQLSTGLPQPNTSGQTLISVRSDGLLVYGGNPGFTDRVHLFDPASGATRQLYDEFSQLLFLENAGSLSFFRDTGHRLWRTDGSVDGSFFLPVSGLQGTITVAATIDNRLFFYLSTTTSGDSYSELWTSDGTVEGTRRLPGFGAATQSTNESSNTTIRERPGFRLGDRFVLASDSFQFGDEPIVTDGTVVGTNVLKDINARSFSSNPSGLITIGNLTFFSADDGVHGREMWRTDGTAAGTFMLKDIVTGTGRAGVKSFSGPGAGLGNNAGQYAPLGNRLLFVAGENQEQLWITDGTTARTTLVSDSLIPGNDNPFVIGPPGQTGLNTLVSTGNRVFFFALIQDPGSVVNSTSRALFVTDGTSAGTRQLMRQAPATSFPLIGGIDERGLDQMVAFGDKVIFALGDEEAGRELWVSDGTTGGTFRLADIRPGAVGSRPLDLTQVAGLVYFTADDGTHGTELWQTDGTSAGTKLVAELVPGPNGTWFPAIGGGSVFTPVLEADRVGEQVRLLSNGVDRLFFRVGNPQGIPGGGVLWSLKAGETNPQPIAPEVIGGSGAMGVLNGKLVFANFSPNKSGAVYVTDGTNEGTRRIGDLASNDFGNFAELLFRAAGDRMFYQSFDDGKGAELFATDGTDRGTGLLADIDPGPNNSLPSRFTALGRRVILTAQTDTFGQELWIVEPPPPQPPSRMFRAYNPNALYHFFTLNKAEFDITVAAGYQDESTGQDGFSLFPSPVEFSTPLYRMYNLQTGRHYYTTNKAERDFLLALVPAPLTGSDNRTVGWRYEGEAGHLYPSQQPGSVELFRLYNNISGTHLYTDNPTVRDAVLAIPGPPGNPDPWELHSSVGWAFFSPGSSTSNASAFAAPAMAAPPVSVAPVANTDASRPLSDETVARLIAETPRPAAALPGAKVFPGHERAGIPRSRPLFASEKADQRASLTDMVDSFFSDNNLFSTLWSGD
jgi:ELWxxDGT repeat protein